MTWMKWGGGGGINVTVNHSTEGLALFCLSIVKACLNKVTCSQGIR